jgi:hypothetical protein
MNITRLIASCGVAAAVLLTGCTSYVTTNVTAFQNWSGRDADRTYTFKHSADQQNNLEQSTYESIVSDALSTYGFKQVDPQQAHYAVSLRYDIRNHSTFVSEPVAVYGSAWRGGWYGGWGGWGGMPPFGPTSVIYNTEPYAIFVKTLQIRIADLSRNGVEVYNVMANNSGPDSSLVTAMPYLVRSALFNFPLANGTSTQVNLPETATGASNERAVGPGAPAAPAFAASGAAGG